MKRYLSFFMGLVLCLSGFVFFFNDGRRLHAGEIAFRKKTILLQGPKKNYLIRVELAETSEQQAMGLMFREKELKEEGLKGAGKTSEGMLFVYKEPQEMSFWMKNTKNPLSIGFFDSKGCLFQSLEMSVPSALEVQPKTYTSKKPGLFALEMKSQWFSRRFTRSQTESGTICFDYK